MQVVNSSAAGPLMEVVDILGDHGDVGEVLPVRYRAVAIVGSDLLHQMMSPQVPGPHPLGVALPSVGAG